MKFRVRSWVGEQSLPNMDVTTDSKRVAAQEARLRAAAYVTGYGDVSVIVPGEMALRGEPLEAWVMGVLDG